MSQPHLEPQIPITLMLYPADTFGVDKSVRRKERLPHLLDKHTIKKKINNQTSKLPQDLRFKKKNHGFSDTVVLKS